MKLTPSLAHFGFMRRGWNGWRVSAMEN